MSGCCLAAVLWANVLTHVQWSFWLRLLDCRGHQGANKYICTAKFLFVGKVLWTFGIGRTLNSWGKLTIKLASLHKAYDHHRTRDSPVLQLVQGRIAPFLYIIVLEASPLPRVDAQRHPSKVTETFDAILNVFTSSKWATLIHFKLQYFHCLLLINVICD